MNNYRKKRAILFDTIVHVAKDNNHSLLTLFTTCLDVHVAKNNNGSRVHSQPYRLNISAYIRAVGSNFKVVRPFITDSYWILAIMCEEMEHLACVACYYYGGFGGMPLPKKF